MDRTHKRLTGRMVLSACSFLGTLFAATAAQLVAQDVTDARAEAGDSTSKSVTATADTAEAKQGQPSLRIGSQAPALTIHDWVQGDSVPSFSKEKIYVVEFWATWCAPCIKAMPHLDELAKKYASDGVIIAAVTSADAANTDESIRHFVETRGNQFALRFGVCQDQSLSDAYLSAAGIQSIPCSFVVDRNGQIAYIGLPNNLDHVLERLIAGTWRGQADMDALTAMEESLPTIMQLSHTDHLKALSLLSEIEQKNPARSRQTDFIVYKSMALMIGKQFDDLKPYIEPHIKRFMEAQDSDSLAFIGGVLISRELNPQKVHYQVGQAALDAAFEAAPDSFNTHLSLTMAYISAYELTRARELADKAMESSPDESSKELIRKLIKTIDQLK